MELFICAIYVDFCRRIFLYFCGFHEEEVVEKKLTNLQELHIIEMEVKSIMKNNSVEEVKKLNQN